ncbi:MAG: hypothetical protein RR415_06590 [Ruthenibacterium sp.]
MNHTISPENESQEVHREPAVNEMKESERWKQRLFIAAQTMLLHPETGINKHISVRTDRVRPNQGGWAILEDASAKGSFVDLITKQTKLDNASVLLIQKNNGECDDTPTIERVVGLCTEPDTIVFHANDGQGEYITTLLEKLTEFTFDEPSPVQVNVVFDNLEELPIIPNFTCSLSCSSRRNIGFYILLSDQEAIEKKGGEDYWMVLDTCPYHMARYAAVGQEKGGVGFSTRRQQTIVLSPFAGVSTSPEDYSALFFEELLDALAKIEKTDSEN